MLLVKPRRLESGHGEAGVPAEANRTLSNLYRIAQAMPGGLELGAVASAVMDEVKETLRSPAGALILFEPSASVVGSFGFGHPEQIERACARIEGPDARVVAAGDLGAQAASLPCDIGCLLVAPLRRSKMASGVIVVVCDDHAQHNENRLIIQELADEASVAVDNVLLFERVRRMSIDEERRRVASELHDGVAQVLAHLRLEIDYLARHASVGAELRQHFERMSIVVGQGSSEVGRLIGGLRTSPDGIRIDLDCPGEAVPA